MLLAINGATLEKCSLADFLETSGRAGYDLVELRKDCLDSHLEKNSLEDLRDLFRRCRLRPATINAIGMSTLQPPAGEAKVLRMTEDFAKAAAGLGCPWIVACPGGKPAGASWDEVLVRSARTFGKMADLAWKHRVGLAFEFLGFPWSSVRTVSEAWAVVKAANRANTGITIDTAHFYSGGSSLAEISTLPREAVAMFHVNDLVDKPRDKIGDYDRVLPGDGVIPLASIVRELSRTGYDGPASLEVFNRGLQKLNPLEVARDGLRKLRKCVR